MQSGIVSLIRGIVRLRVRGDHAETLLNRLVDEHMFVWNVSRLGDELEFDLHLSDFFRLRPLLRETGCRMRVVARFGMPFWLARLEKRKMLAAGALVFVTGLYLLSSFVWSVEIVGNKRISDSEIRRAAEQSGIHPWAWKFRLPQMDELSSRLARLLPDAAWVGVSVQGTRVRIEIVENTLPERRELMNPRHLVSTSDAVVTEIFAERGKPVVRRNTRVKKGDILISGIIGDEEMKQVVVAKGEVRGLVWYEYEIRVPLTQNRKVYTGNEHEKFYLVFGNRALQITGYGKSGYAQEVTLAERSMLRWRNVSLPIGWMTEHTKEVRTEEFQIGAEIAKQIGLAQARADILARFGTDARIHSENILHENMDNGKVYMKVLYEVEHIISTERPIVYTDMEDLETKHNTKE